MAAMTMVRPQSDGNEKQSFGKKTELWIFSFLSRALTSKEALLSAAASEKTGECFFFFNNEKDEIVCVLKVCFARADSSTALLVPLVSKEGSFSLQRCH
jgi:hypothetical protein